MENECRADPKVGQISVQNPAGEPHLDILH
jgi:hypothetical protein